MTFNAGDVVMLKSGGQALTITSVDADEASCIWLGEEGDLFRETIPFVALTSIELEEEENDEEEHEDGEDETDAESSGDDEEEEDEEQAPKRRKAIA